MCRWGFSVNKTLLTYGFEMISSHFIISNPHISKIQNHTWISSIEQIVLSLFILYLSHSTKNQIQIQLLHFKHFQPKEPSKFLIKEQCWYKSKQHVQIKTGLNGNLFFKKYPIDTIVLHHLFTLGWIPFVKATCGNWNPSLFKRNL